MENFYFTDQFVYRHIGPREEDIKNMLATVGVESLEELISKTIPDEIRLKKELNFDFPMSETELLEHLRLIASKNKIFKSYIGMGYYPTVTPPVIQRNILENPGWYTQYTPYQAEISQGRLEALLNFQTVIADLTGLPLTNASLLDEATAAAEAMSMLYSSRKKEKKDADVFLVSENLFPQTLDVLQTRSEPLGIKLIIKNQNEFELNDNVFGIMVQYPDSNGEVYDYSNLFENAKMKNIFTSVVADIMSLVLLIPPGEFGADIAVGSTQRFGMPMGYGGPHAAYLATKEDFKRHIPGRIIGVSIDRNGNPALRMALQMREQHIKREKATSNICTAQVLPAIMSGMYVVYHGPVGLKNIASRISKLTKLLDYGLKELGFKQINKYYFDTLKIELDSSDLFKNIKKSALDKKINLRYFRNDAIGISVSEITSLKDIKILLDIFAGSKGKIFNEVQLNKIMESGNFDIPKEFKRESKFLTHPVFNSYHSETAMMRYIKNLEKKDLSLTTSMIPLGSCTMKLNAAAEMASITWPEFAHIHPFVPISQTEGYQELIVGIQKQLCEITGFSGISLQPNSGALGEFAGLMVIRKYHQQRNQGHRNIVLIPSSAHGTNPASAVMAGNKPVIVNCDENGNIDIEDLKKKAEANADNLSALMVTYPSTHGIFEKDIVKICKIVHDNGGQVYMDGANMNAQVGYTSPKQIGADVCHLNLHKTFAIPHGGGGPGVGPIAVADHLIQYLPSHPVISFNRNSGISAVTASPFGSANILPISYAYIKLMGTEGLKMSTAVAILNANYLQKKLSPYFNVVYTGYNGFVGHELIFDFRNFKKSANVEAEDVAKRLMDYGFHAPTVSFPVHGTLMVEPTESEPKEELDRFCSAMISIKKEIEEIENGTMDREDNVLKNSPHISEDLVTENWTHGYSRRKAVFPENWVKENKFWPAAARINNAYGDRHLVCSLPH